MAARRLHNLIYVTIVNCCLFIIVCSVSLGTNKWFGVSTKGVSLENGIEVRVKASYGLFAGEKTKISGSSTQKSKLKIICQGSKGCMFSCGTTAERRKKDFEDLYNGRVVDSELDKYCFGDEVMGFIGSVQYQSNSNLSRVSHLQQRQNTVAKDGKRIFINFGLYLATTVFLIFGMLFSILSGTLALYNTYRTPIQPILSILGLYVWNAISAVFVLLAMIMWVIEFASRLRKNAAISDTLSLIHDSSGMGSLGVSFWILILPMCFAIANMVILRYRTWKIKKMDEKNVRVITETLETGDILLF